MAGTRSPSKVCSLHRRQEGRCLHGEAFPRIPPMILYVYHKIGGMSDARLPLLWFIGLSHLALSFPVIGSLACARLENAHTLLELS
jgi:hypothetical protein